MTVEPNVLQSKCLPQSFPKASVSTREPKPNGAAGNDRPRGHTSTGYFLSRCWLWHPYYLFSTMECNAFACDFHRLECDAVRGYSSSDYMLRKEAVLLKSAAQETEADRGRCSSCLRVPPRAIRQRALERFNRSPRTFPIDHGERKGRFVLLFPCSTARKKKGPPYSRVVAVAQVFPVRKVIPKFFFLFFFCFRFNHSSYCTFLKI